jgi:hypothetical protein
MAVQKVIFFLNYDLNWILIMVFVSLWEMSRLLASENVGLNLTALSYRRGITWSTCWLLQLLNYLQLLTSVSPYLCKGASHCFPHPCSDFQCKYLN